MRHTPTRRACLTCAVALGLAAAAAAVGRPASAEEPVRIRLATLAPKGSSFHHALLAMAEQWRQAPGGGVALTIYTDGTMGGEADVVRRMRVGQLHAAMLTVVGLSEIDRSVTAIQNLPLMFRSLDEVSYIREKLAPVLEERLLARGFVVLSWGDAGWVRFFSREPVIRPADLKKLRLFVWAGDTHAVDIMKRAGYHPVPLEPNDILPGLQTGLISAVPTIPFYALAGQFYGSARHMLELNWAPLVGAMVITKKTWDTWPPTTRDALLNAAREAGDAITAKSRAEGEEAVETMTKRGLTVHPVTPEVEAEWRKVVEGVYPQIRGRIVPADLFDEVQRVLQEYRAAEGRPAQ